MVIQDVDVDSEWLFFVGWKPYIALLFGVR